MEFDNDRPVKHASKIEIFYWVLLSLINPLIIILSVFAHEPRTWPVLFLISFFMLPAYLFYSNFIALHFLFKKNYIKFFITSIIFIATTQLILYSLYTVCLNFSSGSEQENYFNYNALTIAREITWCLINMCLATGIAFTKKAADDNEMLLNLEKDNAGYKLKYLRSQLNPHFLFNTLNSIYALSLEKSDKTPDTIVKLADLMRYLIYECNEDKVPLGKEIEFIQNYIDIEKIRYTADVRFIVEGETENVMIEPFLFIAFVENGFKHAFNNAYNKAFIYITLKITAAQIELTVVNNTSVDLETQAKKIQGTGILQSKSLLELLYPTTHALNIIQTEKTERKANELRVRNAKRRLEKLYPDSHTLDVILSNNAFTVSLILKNNAA